MSKDTSQKDIVSPPLNTTYDIGRLVITDTNHLLQENETALTENIMLTNAKNSYKILMHNLYNLLDSQQGADKEDINYDVDPNQLALPEPLIKLPRSLSLPKKKELTKWEKYKIEKGINQRKRSRLVYSDKLQEWVPRWGKDSIKKVDDKFNWVMEDKEEGVDPFAKKKMEEKLVKMKQMKRQYKNEERNKANEETNNNNSKKNKKQMKQQKELERLKEDKSNLNKRLEQIQKSTRSMGKFDKKLKNEKEINFLKKKRVNKEILGDYSKEKTRDKKILNYLLNNK